MRMTVIMGAEVSRTIPPMTAAVAFVPIIVSMLIIGSVPRGLHAPEESNLSSPDDPADLVRLPLIIVGS